MMMAVTNALDLQCMNGGDVQKLKWWTLGVTCASGVLEHVEQLEPMELVDHVQAIKQLELGEPEDMSPMSSYADHVAQEVWVGMVNY